jgi:hypothetical protein
MKLKSKPITYPKLTPETLRRLIKSNGLQTWLFDENMVSITYKGYEYFFYADYSAELLALTYVRKMYKQ